MAAQQALLLMQVAMPPQRRRGKGAAHSATLYQDRLVSQKVCHLRPAVHLCAADVNTVAACLSVS
jgi:hypothetical protein